MLPSSCSLRLRRASSARTAPPGSAALRDKGLADGLDVTDDVRGDGFLRRAQKQHIQLPDHVLGLCRLRIPRSYPLRLPGLVGVDFFCSSRLTVGLKSTFTLLSPLKEFIPPMSSPPFNSIPSSLLVFSCYYMLYARGRLKGYTSLVDCKTASPTAMYYTILASYGLRFWYNYAHGRHA